MKASRESILLLCLRRQLTCTIVAHTAVETNCTPSTRQGAGRTSGRGGKSPRSPPSMLPWRRQAKERTNMIPPLPEPEGVGAVPAAPSRTCSSQAFPEQGRWWWSLPPASSPPAPPWALRTRCAQGAQAPLPLRGGASSPSLLRCTGGPPRTFCRGSTFPLRVAWGSPSVATLPGPSALSLALGILRPRPGAAAGSVWHLLDPHSLWNTTVWI